MSRAAVGVNKAEGSLSNPDSQNIICPCFRFFFFFYQCNWSADICLLLNCKSFFFFHFNAITVWIFDKIINDLSPGYICKFKAESSLGKCIFLK